MKNLNSDIFKQIQQFVVSERGKYHFPLTFKTTLEKDLKITGDDADEFIVAFGKKFNVDISDFIIPDYFGPEGGLMATPTPGKIPITLGDLYNAALAGKLMDLSESFRQLVQFVKDMKLPWNVCRSTELYRHLKLRGNDAREFIEAFAQKFDVYITEFDYDRYFPQGSRFYSPIFDFILRKKITLGDLEKAMLSKKLV